jgi:hypothetical protein
VAVGAESAQATRQGAPRSPSGPPLVSGSNAYASPARASGGRPEPGEGGEQERETSAGASEPLIENGLESPLCTQAEADLSEASAANCQTSGFIASAAPTQDYAFDVNINSGPEGSVAAYFQDYLIKPPWALLVWAVHALLVGIEWAFTIDLLRSSAMGSVAGALRGAERTFTHPLVALALVFASLALAWRGLVRREHAASIGEGLAVLAMIGAGLFMLFDPLGTVGELSRFADAASIETLGAVAGGTTMGPDRTLANGSAELFEATVLGPWCFMEFGNVAWCEERRQLDPSLAAAAAKLASHDEAEAAKSGARRSSGLRDIARLLRAARTNGAIFLAAPANGPARNSGKSSSSLLHAICDGPSATQCRGATASEAEFRTSGFTVDRLVGLALIGVGALGMVLLLGFVLVRLLGAAVLSLLFLLLAPGAVLLPAFGERGRGAFRDWLGRLLGAIVAKLLWSFVLGTLFVAMKVILLLGGFGWWVQWLLMAVLWWGAYQQRHRLLAQAHPPVRSRRRSGEAVLGIRRSRVRSARHDRVGRAAERGGRDLARAARGDGAPIEPARLPGPPRSPRSQSALAAVEPAPLPPRPPHDETAAAHDEEASTRDTGAK